MCPIVIVESSRSLIACILATSARSVTIIFDWIRSLVILQSLEVIRASRCWVIARSGSVLIESVLECPALELWWVEVQAQRVYRDLTSLHL
jgi:hypothetical protein